MTRPYSFWNPAPQPKLSRRQMLLSAGAVIASTSIGANRSSAQSVGNPSNLELRIATYGGSWRDAIEKNITPALMSHGVKITFIIGSPEDNLARVIAARRENRVPFDVMDGMPYFYNDAVRNGFLAKIDYSKLNNKTKNPTKIFSEAQVIVEWTPECIVYNEAKFESIGVAPPERYSDLSEPKLRGRVSFPNVSHVQHWAAVVGLAREHGGDEANLDMVPDLIRKMGASYYYSNSAELASRFSSGDIWAAPWGGGWAVRLKRGNVPVAVSYVKFGDKIGSLWPNIKWIIGGTPNLNVAHEYIDLWLEAENPAKFCEATGTVPVNPKAREIMVKDPHNKAMLLLTDEQIEKAYVVNWERFDTKKWRDTWQRVVQ